MWAFIRPHRKALLGGAFLGLIATGATLATPMVTKRILETLESGTSLAQPVGLLIGLLIVGSATGLGQHLVLGNLSVRIVYDARTSLINRFFRAKLEHIQKMRTGEMITRVTSDTVLLREATTDSIVQLLNGVVALVGTVILMATLDLSLLAITFITMILVAIPLIVLTPKIGQAEKQAQAAVGELGHNLESGLKAIRTVKAAGAEQREIHAATEVAQTAAKQQRRAVWIESSVWTLVGTGVQLAIIVVLGFGAWRVSQDALSVSALVAFLLYAFNIVEPVTSLTMSFTQLQSGLAASARIQETHALPLEDLTAKSANPQPANPVSNMEPAASMTIEKSTVNPRISFNDVSAGYADNPNILKTVSFHIPAQGHVALVGPSGAGKTTIFSLLLRFLEPREGTIHIEGTDYQQLSLEEVRAKISYVEQETPVLRGSIADNVRYRFPSATTQDIWQALSTVGLAERIESMPDGLDTPISGTRLSGGERQRLAIARAIVGSPQLLLLDEATAQLDGLSEAAIQEVIHNFARTGTVVTIAHRLSTVIDADNIMLLESGRLRAQGTHDQLLSEDELYQELVAALKIQASP